jgi:hypothetical protein
MSLTKLSLGGNNDFICKLFPPRESLLSDIPAGDGNIEKLFFTLYLLFGWGVPCEASFSMGLGSFFPL